jgi:hypothetical protein
MRNIAARGTENITICSDAYVKILSVFATKQFGQELIMKRDDRVAPELKHPQRIIPDLNAPIMPGVCLAGILIGSRFEPAPEDGHKYEVQKRGDSVIYSLHAVKVWTRDGLVYQVAALDGYRGTLPNGIGIGSTILEVEERCRCEVIEDENDDLITPCLPGWSFDTTEWKSNRRPNEKRDALTIVNSSQGLNENRDAKTTIICVFKP